MTDSEKEHLKQKFRDALERKNKDQRDGHGTAHLDAWNNDAEWQGIRKVTEALTAIDDDWGESVFATNVVFEPLLGELFRSNLVQQAAAGNGDFVTPTVMGAGEFDYAQRDLRWTQACFGPLVQDKEFAEHNRALMQGWLSHWVPQALEAALARLADERSLAAVATSAAHETIRQAALARTTGDRALRDVVRSAADPQIRRAALALAREVGMLVGGDATHIGRYDAEGTARRTTGSSDGSSVRRRPHATAPDRQSPSRSAGS